MKLDELDYELPKRLLADKPREMRGEERHDARLLVMHKTSGMVEIKTFRDLPEYLDQGDVVVLNKSRTLNASCFAKVEGLGRVEMQFRSNPERGSWYVSPRPWSTPAPGSTFEIDGSGVGGVIVGTREKPALWLIRFEDDADVVTVLSRYGRPIPSPYVSGTFSNDYYNTVYAEVPGSAEMPAAGRHFTRAVLSELSAKGVLIAYLTLHTGLSSVDVTESTFEEHTMFEEWYSIDQETADLINGARDRGGRVLAVGTTVVRVLESVADEQGHLKAQTNWTDMYICPGYRFKVPDAFITNFHGPRTSRIAMAAAFTGKDLLLKGYAKAIAAEMLFFEFGDATLTLPD